jgi:hypothetical protein
VFSLLPSPLQTGEKPRETVTNPSGLRQPNSSDALRGTEPPSESFEWRLSAASQLIVGDLKGGANRMFAVFWTMAFFAIDFVAFTLQN